MTKIKLIALTLILAAAVYADDTNKAPATAHPSGTNAAPVAPIVAPPKTNAAPTEVRASVPFELLKAFVINSRLLSAAYTVQVNEQTPFIQNYEKLIQRLESQVKPTE